MIICASIAFTLLLLEAVIRIGGETDADGQFTFMGFALEPYTLPVNQLRTGVEGYIANKDISVVVYDETLGWTYRPNSIRQAGTFTINDSGFRSKHNYSPVPSPDTLRIALFGDSFTAGDEVSDDEAWARKLEIMLTEMGLRAEALGWSYPPNANLEDGTFSTNSIGIRAQHEFTETPPADSLRVALFGDSFVADVDVNDDEAWALQLEVKLDQAGIRAEVMNFGVSGYGMGQAYLRWQELGYKYSPDIVIFGLQPENLNRNVNIFRTIYQPQGPFIFSKPRFILNGQDLSVVNNPTLTPEGLIAAYREFDSHPLAAYEFYYDSHHLVSQWWSESWLMVLLHDFLQKNVGEAEDYSPTSERFMLGKAIIDAFAAEVEAAGGSFLTIHLPLREHLRGYHEGRESPFGEFLEYVEGTYDYIPLEEYLGPEYIEQEYWGATHHYGPQINRVVADILATEITDCIRNATCALSRFRDMSEFEH